MKICPSPALSLISLNPSLTINRQNGHSLNHNTIRK
jgi:hypothetical protein